MALVCASSFDYILSEILYLDSSMTSSSMNKNKKPGRLIDNVGFDVGYRLSESIASNIIRPVGIDPLDIVKFICKDIWTYIFDKKIDKLQTNHRGVFVLSDNEFKWLKQYIEDDDDNVEAAERLMRFPCALIRGALANLGLNSIVTVDLSTHPSVSFSIKIKL